MSSRKGRLLPALERSRIRHHSLFSNMQPSNDPMNHRKCNIPMQCSVKRQDPISKRQQLPLMSGFDGLSYSNIFGQLQHLVLRNHPIQPPLTQPTHTDHTHTHTRTHAHTHTRTHAHTHTCTHAHIKLRRQDRPIPHTNITSTRGGGARSFRSNWRQSNTDLLRDLEILDPRKLIRSNEKAPPPSSFFLFPRWGNKAYGTFSHLVDQNLSASNRARSTNFFVEHGASVGKKKQKGDACCIFCCDMDHTVPYWRRGGGVPVRSPNWNTAQPLEQEGRRRKFPDSNIMVRFSLLPFL